MAQLIKAAFICRLRNVLAVYRHFKSRALASAAVYIFRRRFARKFAEYAAEIFFVEARKIREVSERDLLRVVLFDPVDQPRNGLASVGIETFGDALYFAVGKKMIEKL